MGELDLILPPDVGAWPWSPGTYYNCRPLFSGTEGNVLLTADLLYTNPFVVPTGHGIDRIGVNVTTGAAAGKLLKFTVYLVGSNGLPSDLVLTSGTTDAAATGVREVTVSVDGGRMLIVGVASDGAPTVAGFTNATVFNTPFGLASATGALNGTPFKSSAYASPPNPFGTPSGFTTSVTPRVLVRAT